MAEVAPTATPTMNRAITKVVALGAKVQPMVPIAKMVAPIMIVRRLPGRSVSSTGDGRTDDRACGQTATHHALTDRTEVEDRLGLDEQQDAGDDSEVVAEEDAAKGTEEI